MCGALDENTLYGSPPANVQKLDLLKRPRKGELACHHGKDSAIPFKLMMHIHSVHLLFLVVFPVASRSLYKRDTASLSMFSSLDSKERVFPPTVSASPPHWLVLEDKQRDKNWTSLDTLGVFCMLIPGDRHAVDLECRVVVLLCCFMCLPYAPCQHRSQRWLDTISGGQETVVGFDMCFERAGEKTRLGICALGRHTEVLREGAVHCAPGRNIQIYT